MVSPIVSAITTKFDKPTRHRALSRNASALLRPGMSDVSRCLPAIVAVSPLLRTLSWASYRNSRHTRKVSPPQPSASQTKVERQPTVAISQLATGGTTICASAVPDSVSPSASPRDCWNTPSTAAVHAVDLMLTPTMPKITHSTIHCVSEPLASANAASEGIDSSSPGSTTLREPKRSISAPRNGPSTAVNRLAIDGPSESSVRLQPNSRVRGSKKIPAEATSSEKNEKPIDAANTSVQ